MTSWSNDSLNRAVQPMYGEKAPATEVADTDLVDFVQNSLAALETLLEEVRIDLNLARKAVRDRWRRRLARRSP